MSISFHGFYKRQTGLQENAGGWSIAPMRINPIASV